jgi:cobyrinic acid a,c-diamide synthase
MPTERDFGAIMVAGTHSGAGKTTVTLGLMAALVGKGLAVQPFKCGPDFIDPTLHQLVTGRVSPNLDPWMCGPDFVRRTFSRHGRTVDLAVIEGVMGMFDGGGSSSAALARLLGVPVVLVVDVRSAAESVAAMVKGFETLDPEVAPLAVFLNRVGSERHLSLLRTAIEEHCRAEVIGHLPRDLHFAMPERHLGLHLGEEEPITRGSLALLAETVARTVDLDRLLEIARKYQGGDEVRLPEKSADAGVRIGVARDRAFCFYYQENLELLRQAGAELVFFSPLVDQRLPEEVAGLYLGGGYPELHAGQLARNTPMLAAIKAWAEEGGMVYGECGGFMYLTEGIEDLDGDFHPLTGVFPVRARMRPRRVALGYRELRLREKGALGPAGTRLRGHEFHYSEIGPMPPEIERLDEGDADSGALYRYKRVLGGYVHLHFGFSPQAAAALVNACRGKE